MDAASAARSEAARTPLMRQYLSTKQEHPDAFLFFRLGDFYELFFEDAVEAARLLGLTLTSRNKQDAHPIPMCGIPWHQRDGYVGRLLRLGHKVAICDQLEDPAQAKGLVQRGVTEILTPGSVTSDHFLEAAAHNYLGVLWPERERVGVALADASTGETRLLEAAWDEAGAALSRVLVAEWLVPEGLPEEIASRVDTALAGLPGARSRAPAIRFAEGASVLDRWSVADRERLDDVPLALRAASGALEYLDRSQGGAALQMTRVERWSEDSVLRFDAATARHLELFTPQPGGETRHTLWHHLDLSVSALGARRLRSWLERPLASVTAITARQERIAAWLAPDAPRGAFRETLRGLPDLERLASRIAASKATPRDLGAVRDALTRLPEVARTLGGLSEQTFSRAKEALAVSPSLLDTLGRALVDEPPAVSKEGGILREGYDEVRDHLHALSHSG